MMRRRMNAIAVYRTNSLGVEDIRWHGTCSFALGTKIKSPVTQFVTRRDYAC